MQQHSVWSAGVPVYTYGLCWEDGGGGGGGVSNWAKAVGPAAAEGIMYLALRGVLDPLDIAHAFVGLLSTAQMPSHQLACL